jgi:hypothetical protein
MDDHQEAAYAVIAVEHSGFKGSSSFHFEATRLASFVKGLDRLRRGDLQEAVFELPQYPDCQIIVQPAPCLSSRPSEGSSALLQASPLRWAIGSRSGSDFTLSGNSWISSADSFGRGRRLADKPLVATRTGEATGA